MITDIALNDIAYGCYKYYTGSEYIYIARVGMKRRKQVARWSRKVRGDEVSYTPVEKEVKQFRVLLYVQSPRAVPAAVQPHHRSHDLIRASISPVKNDRKPSKGFLISQRNLRRMPHQAFSNNWLGIKYLYTSLSLGIRTKH